ncbi:chromosomal replication initiator protein DnaA [Coralliovum pocilloporae]|uniref:chromosomal replication initiator protein DnaA n=1 Tax=Coralliovum pocilloporae TaxID=3066369 RepID=UPI003306F3A1
MTLEQTGEDHWKRVKQKLRRELGEDVFSSWFASVDLEERSNGTVHLSVPTRFLKSWIQSHYRERLMSVWQGECEDVQQIELTVRGAIRQRPTRLQRPGAPKSIPVRQAQVPTAGVEASAGTTSFKGTTESEDLLGGSPLDARLTFDSFVIGGCNTLAHAAAKQVAEAPKGAPATFNPLYLHASVGLGKTHLLQAIAWHARERTPERRVLYLTAERFMYRFVAALKNQSAIAFKDALRDIDLLLIDDLQFLQGKSIQQEFCHTLNSLIDGARQVVVASDRPPVELESLDERVRSRLAGGLVAEIADLDSEMRRAILLNRARAAMGKHPGLDIPDPVLDHVARIVSSNGRDLDGAFNRLMAHNQLTGAPITLDMVDTALRDLLRNKEPKRVRIEDIQRIVSKHFNVSRADLLSSRRTRVIVRPRQIAMYLAKILTPRSLPEIGRRFGGRDHTTVLHAVRKIEDLIKTDQALHQEIESLRREAEE